MLIIHPTSCMQFHENYKLEDNILNVVFVFTLCCLDTKQGQHSICYLCSFHGTTCVKMSAEFQPFFVRLLLSQENHVISIIKNICLVSRQHKTNTRTTFNILSMQFSWNYMHKIGHIVCITSIIYVQDHLTMSDILVGLNGLAENGSRSHRQYSHSIGNSVATMKYSN